MDVKNFVHLHVHTEYSLLDGAARINELLETAKNFGMTSLAITDHGTMYGVINFYKAALKCGIKPIIGCEVYVAPNSRFDKETLQGSKYFHLVLLAENNKGYKNLIKLATVAATEGFYYRPRIDKESLRKYHEGLIALSACVAGEIPKAILNEDFSHAKEIIQEYIEIFGRENFFLEVQNHGLESESKVRAALKEFSAELNIALVATNDSHYLRREDSEFHDLLICIQTGKTLNDNKRLKFSSDNYYLKSAQEMRELFSDMPEACDNTLRIAARCNVKIEFEKFQMPEFPLPALYTNAALYLRELCYKKISTRFEIVTDEIKARLDYELKIIHSMGYDGYFLIVWDFINFARQQKIPVGPGRGSAAGSLVAYVLEITELNPLKYNLLFERFLNPERVTLPDIDVDLCYLRRDEVIEYVRSRYGAEKVSQIATFGTLAAKAAIRDVARVLNISFAESSRLAKLIPNVLNITLDEALTKYKKLRTEYETNSVSRKIIDFAKKLEGLPRHLSVHAAGVVISKEPLEEIVPLQRANGVLITQYDKDKIEELGLLKMDFLGLRTLTIIANTLSNIKNSRGVELDLSEIPLCDERTSKMLSSGDTSAVFQMESPGMTKLVKELQPESFEDLIPTVALYRPGPLGSGMVEDFIAGRHGRKVTNYLHPKLEPILKETFGVILYQEQVMQIVQTLAGFTLGQADLLRRAMSKKKADILLAQKENFLRGCESNGVEKILAEKIFELLSHFADYGFNKSHSAAYGLLAWRTAYLKEHYPAEYMAAMMSSLQDEDKIDSYLKLVRRMKIEILIPDINRSATHFTIDKGAIRFGLSSIKNLGKIALESILQEREIGGSFKSLADFCGRVDLKNFTRAALENLIKCGAFDSLDKRRKRLLETLEETKNAGLKRQKNKRSGVITLFDEEDFPCTENTAEAEEISLKDILVWERDSLGFYISGHPLEDYHEKFSTLTKSTIINSGRFTRRRAKVGGIITSMQSFTTRNGGRLTYLKLEDFEGIINIMLLPDVSFQNLSVVKLGEIVVIEGSVDYSSEPTQILAKKIVRAAAYSVEFWLTIPLTLESPETIAKLNKIFKEHTGNHEVFLNLRGNFKKLEQRISNESSVRKKLIELLGAENILLY